MAGTNQSVLIAAIQPGTVGQVLDGHTVSFPNAFDSGVSADVVYHYAEFAFSQDVVINKALKAPSVFGLPDTNTLLAVLTEIIVAPAMSSAPDTIDLTPFNQADGVQGAASLSDQDIRFHSMHLERGRAFSMNGAGGNVPVSRSIQQLGTRWFLVESSPYPLLKKYLATLPPDTGMAAPPAGGQGMPCATGSLKPRSLEQAVLRAPSPTRSPARPRLAAPAFRRADSFAQAVMPTGPGSFTDSLTRALAPPRSLVIDYILVSTSQILNLNLVGVDGAKTGPAAVGMSAADFWCGYGNSTWGEWQVYWSNGSGETSAYAFASVLTANNTANNGTTDAMYANYLSDGSEIVITLDQLTDAFGGASMNFDVLIYGHGSQNADNMIASYTTYTGASSYSVNGTRGTTIWGGGWNNTATWEEG